MWATAFVVSKHGISQQKELSGEREGVLVPAVEIGFVTDLKTE